MTEQERQFTLDAPIEVRDAAKREIGLRMVPWGTVIETREGLEMFQRGAFDDVDPSTVRLRMDHADPPTGKGLSIEQLDDAGYGVFRVARTARGDEQLTLAIDGVADGASVGFREVPGGSEYRTIDGRRVRVHKKVDLMEVSTTWRPAYASAGVQFVRSEGVPEVADVTDVTPAPVAPAYDNSEIIKHLERLAGGQEQLRERMEAMQERTRQAIEIPTSTTSEPSMTRGDWMTSVIKVMSGERLPTDQLRALDEIVTGDNLGVVPDAHLSEIVGIINSTRPFLNSTRRLPLEPAGMSLVVPVIETRPETGIQAEEKDDIASNTTSITTDSFDFITIAGGGDLSIQIIKRSSPSFLSLYQELLFESYAKNTEIEALKALYLGDTPGGTLNPSNALFGQAWKHGTAVGVPPDTLWLSSTGVAQFIDAKATGTNAPLYSTIQAGFTAGSGPAGTISGLRPVFVPAMDLVGDVDAIVGPSRGFAWMEDGTYTLQVDVPSKAGRDVAIVGMIVFAPLYPSAFTTYQISS